MNVAFRVDASDKIGTGSFMRCLTLAEALRNEGASVQFFCRQHPGNLIELLKLRSIPVTALPAPENTKDISDNDGYACWLGVSQEEDAEQVINQLASIQPQWLVVDHYGIDEIWEQRLQPHAHKIMVIDDLANRRHKCSLLLDQNYTAQRRYEQLVPQHCVMLLGPMYALLRSEYAACRARQTRRYSDIGRILVYFGGSDSANISELAMQALSSPQLKHLVVDLLIGANNPHHTSLMQHASSRPSTFADKSQTNLANLMAQADLAVGAGGATTWEHMCLGLPSLLVTCAENQIPLAQTLTRENLIWLIGDSTLITAAQIHDAIVERLSGQNHASVSASTSQICDGSGTSRVLESMKTINTPGNK